MAIRLQKFLADAGAASRRQAERMIAAGRVTVNGKTVTEPGVRADPTCDTVTLDGKKITPETAFVYIMLHKPEGVVTSISDPQHRPVVMDYVKITEARVFPVGRLDYDSSGLLLLTNDGRLSYALTHPKYAVDKTYIARLRGIPDKKALRAFESGLLIDGTPTAPAKIKLLKTDRRDGGTSTVRVVIHEGRNRQVRKMCEAIGHPVTQLKRVSIGAVHLGDLPRGACRFLTEAELRRLQPLC